MVLESVDESVDSDGTFGRIDKLGLRELTTACELGKFLSGRIGVQILLESHCKVPKLGVDAATPSVGRFPVIKYRYDAKRGKSLIFLI